MTPEKSAHTELRLGVADGLEHRRKQGRLTHVAAARLLNSSQSRLATMEAGDPSVSLGLPIRSHRALGGSTSDIAGIIGRAA